MAVWLSSPARQTASASRSPSGWRVPATTASSAQNRGLLGFGASKAGLNQLTKDLAVEWAPHRVRVNAIQPCQFRTRGWANTIDNPAHADLVATVLHGIPMGRMGEPPEMV